MAMTREELVQRISEQKNRLNGGAIDTSFAEKNTDTQKSLKERLRQTARRARRSLLITVTLLTGVQGLGAQNLVNSNRDTLPEQEKMITIAPQDLEKMPTVLLPQINKYEKVSIEEQFTSPASAHTDAFLLSNQTNVGAITSNMIENAGNMTWKNMFTKVADVTNAAKDFKVSKEEKSLREVQEEGRLAYAQGSNITINRLKLTDEERQNLEANPTGSGYYYLGHTLSEIATYYHEKAHVQHAQNNLLNFANQTPAMNVEVNWQTEKVATFTEIAATINGYFNMKNSGVEVIQFRDGLSAPIDAHMDRTYPGIMELVNEHGFSLTNEESLIKIAEFASEYWDGYCSYSYTKNFTENAKSFQNTKDQDILAYIENAKQQDTRLNMMCENLDIGWGLAVDIPVSARYLMSAPTKAVDNIVHTAYLETKNEGNPISTLSTKGLSLLGDYMSQQGLSEEGEKIDWLKKEYAKITNREDGASMETQAVFIQAGNESHITFSDGLYASYSNDGKDLSYVLRGNDEVMVAQQLEAYKQAQTSSLQNKDTIKTQTAMLTKLAMNKGNTR